MLKLIAFLDSAGLQNERRLTLPFSSLVTGVILLLAASLYVMPKFTLQYHGYYYGEMSQSPFDFDADNPMQFRILTPVIAYLLNLSLKAYVFLPLLFGALLLATLYYWHRKLSYTPSEAIAISASVGFSCTTLIPLIAPGYTDTTSYLLILLCFIFVKNKALLSVFLCLALFNHEGTFFMWPALFAYAFQKWGFSCINLLKLISGGVVSLILYFLFRYLIAPYSTAAPDISYYLSYSNILSNLQLIKGYVLPGAFFAFKLFWVLPFLYIYYLLKEKDFAAMLSVVLCIAGASAQVLVAYDITRLYSMAFMAIVLSAAGLKKFFPNKYAAYLWALVLLNLVVPQFYVSPEGFHFLMPTPLGLLFAR